ncbi:uncharacterized protein LOC101175269 [Oryzias latipes]|uniref:Matrin-type domain-containing protein n=1 Tax=Oryzias latipes TaxID=8090 RepID=A0A3B3HVA6_ORYLA|nr:uncharacterized protein LOC101175269 [Oryzias latipes]XP_023822158.1 uncharacterized protein LOC101175269 [Oryzias latipes]
MDAFRERLSAEKPGHPPQEQPEPPQLKFTAEAAVALLQRFGLEKEDLEELVLYPEDQMTPIKLAEILRKIREEKDQRSGLESCRSLREDEGPAGRMIGFNDGGTSSSVASHSSSLKSGKSLQESKTSSAERPKLKPKQSLKSKVSKSAPPPLKKKKKPGALETVQTDGKNSSCKRSGKALAAAKPVTPAKKRKQEDQEPSVSGPPTKLTAVHAAPSHSSRQFPTEVLRSLPTPAMIQDYAAETPRVFPHSCCLCSKDSADMMDWFFHQTSSLHLLNCTLLRKRFPDWDGEVRSIRREASHWRQPHASWRPQEKRRRSWDGPSRSPPDLPPSRSRSRSPHRQRGSSAQQDRRGRRSPGLHRRRDSRERRSRSPSGSPHRKSSSADRGNPSRRGDVTPGAPPSPRRSRGRSSSTVTPLSNAERVAKRMLKNSAVQVLSRQSDVQTAVRTLAPVLLAELAKMASPSSPCEAETLELAKKVAKKLSKEKPVLKKSKRVTAGSVKSAASKKLQSKVSVDKKKALKKKAAVKVKAVRPKQTRTKNPGGTQPIQKKPGEPVKELVSAGCVSAAAVTSSTVGERLEENLTLTHFHCFDILELMENSSKKTKQLLNIKQMLITNLPQYHDGCYTQGELAKVLCPFGFELGEDNIYVIPQTQTAVVQMVDSADLQRAVGASAEGVFFKESRLGFAALSTKISMQPFGFYKDLMKKMSFKVTDDGTSTVFIQDISPCEVRKLRDALRKIGSVKNFLPLLNKVFVEFESTLDVDRLGVWFGLLKRGFGCRVYRLKTPTSSSTALPPRLPAKALPDNRDIVNGVIVLVTKCDVPEGSTSPFWIPMTTVPYLFPTASAWFIIPNYVTVKATPDIQTAGPIGSKFCTVMLTGLPEGNYTFTDITKRVSPYFPKEDDSVLSSRVVVLPLQRRAFIFFNNWNMCSTFAEDCLRSPVTVRGCHLNIHFVLEDMHLHSSEVVMYRNLMKWSNGYLPQRECLEERLLLVEIFQTSVLLIEMVVNVVASIAPFVSFLPLANTIYIEMAEPRGVKEVVNNSSLRSRFTEDVWMKIRYIRPFSVKVLSENLQDCQQETGTHPTCTPLQTSSSEPAPSVGFKPTTSAAATQSLRETSADSVSDSPSPLGPSAAPLPTHDRMAQEGRVEMETSDLHSNQDGSEEARSPGPERGESRNQILMETRAIQVDSKDESPTKRPSRVQAGTVQEEEDAHLKSDPLKDQPPAAETQSVRCGHVTVEMLPEEENPPNQQQEEKVGGYQTGAEDEAPTKEAEGLESASLTSSASDGREEAVMEPDEGASEEPAQKLKEEPIKEEDPAGGTSPGLHHVKVESLDGSDDRVEEACEDPSRSERAGPEERPTAGEQPAAGVIGDPPAAAGVIGDPPAAAGVRGDPPAAAGVIGDPPAAAGVRGDPPAAAGVRGDPPAAAGLRGDPPAAAGVRGDPQTLQEPQRFEVDLAAREDDRLNVSRPTKRKLGDDTEETLKPDEMGRTPEDLQKPAANRPRGRPRKKMGVANVRKSPKGKPESPGAERREEDGKTSAGPEAFTPEIQKRAKDAGNRPTKEKDEEVTVSRPQARRLVHLEGTQTRSGRVPARSILQPFNPNRSYGQEFTVPTKAFYCNLCSVFYMRETAEDDLHCCSKLHYDKLREYFQKRAQLRKCSRKLR